MKWLAAVLASGCWVNAVNVTLVASFGKRGVFTSFLQTRAVKAERLALSRQDGVSTVRALTSTLKPLVNISRLSGK